MDSQPSCSKDLPLESDDWIEDMIRNEDLSDVDDSDVDKDYVINSDHNTSSEQSEDSSDDEITCNARDNTGRFYYGKNGFKWSVEPFHTRNTRTQRHNIMVQLPGLKQRARALGTKPEPLETWGLMIDDDILNIIIHFTNLKLQKAKNLQKNPNTTEMRNVDLIEMKAFIGLLFYSAIFKSNHEDTRAMWATDGTGRDIFRCVLSRNRFEIILSHLRFDDRTDRDQRIQENPAAAISEVFERFLINCRDSYSIGAYATIDEMLVGFRGRCKFRMFMPKKPCKYGIKIQALVDSQTHYFSNGYIYVGKDSDGNTLDDAERQYSKPTQSVIRLTKEILYSNRNITTDNWYSSIEIADLLLQRGLTFVGTMRHNKQEIPPEFKPQRRRAVGSSVYGFTAKKTIVSHVPKKGKSVILLSTMHNTTETDKETGKPEINIFYNHTKGGVDCLDEKCAIYCSSRRTRRWPMAIFFRILDISAVNAYVLHYSYRDNEKITRLIFMKKLANALVRPHLERRIQDFHISHELRACIGRVLQIKPPAIIKNNEGDRLEKKKTCHLCDPNKKRKSFYVCYECRKPVCLECTKKICHKCIEEKND